MTPAALQSKAISKRKAAGEEEDAYGKRPRPVSISLRSCPARHCVALYISIRLSHVQIPSYYFLYSTSVHLTRQVMAKVSKSAKLALSRMTRDTKRAKANRSAQKQAVRGQHQRYQLRPRAIKFSYQKYYKRIQ